MKLSQFDYNLPPELIALNPLDERDASRMLVLDRKRGTWKHGMFRDLPGMVSSRDLMVFNESRVVKARLLGKRSDTGGSVEIFVLGAAPVAGQFECLVKLTTSRKVGVEFLLGDGVAGKILGPVGQSMRWIVEFRKSIS